MPSGQRSPLMSLEARSAQLFSSSLVSSSNLLSQNLYGYKPSLWVGITFGVVLSITTTAHIVQAAHSRLWWLLWTACMCGVLEILGWEARVLSAYNDTKTIYYIIQSSATVIAPTFFLAANFIVLGQIIARLGQCYSRLSAKRYTAIFVSCDVFALSIQGAGGGIASSAAASGKISSVNLSLYITLAGIVFQLIALIAYLVLAAEFLVRVLKDRPVRSTTTGHGETKMDKPMKFMLYSLGISSVLIFIRTIYRTAELADGYDGAIVHTQWLFVVFDGLMVILALCTTSILHPARLLGPRPIWKHYERQDGYATALPDTEDPFTIELGAARAT